MTAEDRAALAAYAATLAALAAAGPPPVRVGGVDFAGAYVDEATP